VADLGPARDWRFRLTPFVFGVIFVTIGVVGMGRNGDADVSWVWVALLAGVGVGGLIKALDLLRT
jgi:hypothetical protein